MTARRHPNPITDCGHSAAGREGCTERSETAKERRMEINKWRPQDGREEREETTRVQKQKEKRQTSLSFEVK